MKRIEIEDFISIIILENNNDGYIYYVDKYNKKYFYKLGNDRLFTHQGTNTKYMLYFQKAETIDWFDIEKLENDVNSLYKQLTFSIPRANHDETYFTITENFKVIQVVEIDSFRDDNNYEKFNYFLSEEEAQKVAKELHECLIKIRKRIICEGE